MNSDFDNKLNGHQWLSMSEAAQFTPYSAEYLSLLSRKRKLPAKKIGNAWFTTKAAVEYYMRRQMMRTSIQSGALGALPEEEVPAVLPEETKISEDKLASLERINYIRRKLTHGLLGKIIEEQRREKFAPMMPVEKILEEKIPGEKIIEERIPEERKEEPQSLLIREIKKLSESVGGLSSKIEEIVSTEKEKLALPFAEIQSIFDKELESPKFRDKLNKFLDSSLEEHLGLISRGWQVIKQSFRTVVSRPALLLIFFSLLILLMAAPGRSIFGFFDDALNYAYNHLKDAQTVLGFRPGTHENEILLLDKKGNISISGHVETEGQFRSFIKDGTAPIVVDSKTMVSNLNVEYLNGLKAEEFTLAYVTKNGNVTTEDVYLNGDVEIGKILLVKGATKLLSSLEVDGEISVFGNAVFKKSITVEGPAYFNALLNAKDIAASGLITGQNINGQTVIGRDVVAQSTLTSDGNFKVGGQSIFGGFAFFNSGLQARSGDFDISLGVGGDFSARGNITLGYANKNASITSQNWSITTAGAASFGSVVTGSLTATTLTTTNFSASKASTTQFSVSDYFWSNGTTTIGDDASDTLNIAAGNWILASSTATTTVAMTSGLNFDSGTFVIDPYSNFVGIGTTSPYAKFPLPEKR